MEVYIFIKQPLFFKGPLIALFFLTDVYFNILLGPRQVHDIYELFIGLET